MASKQSEYFSQLRTLSPLFVLALLSLGSYLLGPDISRFDRAAIVQGEWWRLLSCHISHLGFNHLVINLAGLILLALLFNGLLVFCDWILGVVLVAIATGACLYLFEPQLQRYVGLSGLLHGLMVYAALLSWSRQPLINSALLLIIVVKLSKEWALGPGEVEQFIGGTVLIMSHLYGAVSGLVLGVIQLICRNIFKQQLQRERISS